MDTLTNDIFEALILAAGVSVAAMAIKAWWVAWQSPTRPRRHRRGHRGRAGHRSRSRVKDFDEVEPAVMGNEPRG